MRSKMKAVDLEEMACSCMRWLEGEEVHVYLDWDENWYYVWFEPTSLFEDFCEEVCGSTNEMLKNLREEIEKIGVHQFCDLDDVNEYIEQYCGDNEPSMFYVDDTFGYIVGT